MTTIIKNPDCPHWQTSPNEFVLIDDLKMIVGWSMQN